MCEERVGLDDLLGLVRDVRDVRHDLESLVDCRQLTGAVGDERRGWTEKDDVHLQGYLSGNETVTDFASLLECEGVHVFCF